MLKKRKKKKKEVVEEEVEEEEKLIAPEPPKTNGIHPFDKEVETMFDLEWFQFQNYYWDPTPRFVEIEYLHIVKEKEMKTTTSFKLETVKNNSFGSNVAIMEKGESILDVNGLEHHKKKELKQVH